jgi:hypothetical protein
MIFYCFLEICVLCGAVPLRMVEVLGGEYWVIEQFSIIRDIQQP